MAAPGDIVTAQATCTTSYLLPAMLSTNGHYVCLTTLGPGDQVLDQTYCTARGLGAHMSTSGVASTFFTCTDVPTAGDHVLDSTEGAQLCAKDGWGESHQGTASATAYDPSEAVGICDTSTPAAVGTFGVSDGPVETSTSSMASNVGGLRTDGASQASTAHADAGSILAKITANGSAAHGDAGAIQAAITSQPVGSSTGSSDLSSIGYGILAVLLVFCVLSLMFEGMRTVGRLFA